METIIEFRKVSKEFSEKKIIQNLDIKIQTGEIFVLVGPSGSGKTTILKMINALQIPTKGDIFFKNKKIKDYDIRKLRWQIGYVLQQIALFPTMSVHENIEVIPEMLGWNKQQRREATDQLLQQVNLPPKIYRDRLPSELSGGEQQRIGILRAIAARPDVILMDEPFSALDPISKTQLQDLVLLLHKELKNTIIFVTHDMKEALKVGDRIGIVKDGKILQCDTPEEIAAHPKNSFVKKFFANTRTFPDIYSTTVSELLDAGFYQKSTQNSHQNQNRKTVHAKTPFSELFTILAEENEVAIQKQETILGHISRKDIMEFLSKKQETKN